MIALIWMFVWVLLGVTAQAMAEDHGRPRAGWPAPTRQHCPAPPAEEPRSPICAYFGLFPETLRFETYLAGVAGAGTNITCGTCCLVAVMELAMALVVAESSARVVRASATRSERREEMAPAVSVRRPPI